jgi:hypothetical protein
MVGKASLVVAMVSAGLLAACGFVASGEEPAGTQDLDASAAQDGAATTAQPDGATVAPGIGGLPCDVGQVIASRCASCHGSGSQTPRLASAADVTANADRILARMKDAANPMPPTYAGGPASASEIAVVEAWVKAGKPAGSCGAGSDAGSVGDGAPPVVAPTTCASGSTWTGGNRGSDDMNPGQACRSCHAGTGGEGPMLRYMGTVYPSLHEKDNCNAKPSGKVAVEILDEAGAILETIRVRSSSGNFMSVQGGVPGRYRARVTVDGVVKSEMKSFQTNGDCNSCHTEQGKNGAPGRVLY